MIKRIGITALICILVYILGIYIHSRTIQQDWPSETSEINIPCTVDDKIQKAMVYFSSKKNKPLIVSLHTWGGNYLQRDSISILAIAKDYNYIHPDFRGKNNHIDACCSDKVISDIDDAIQFMIEENNANVNEIYIIGASGGGYATLCTYMKSKFSAKKYASWAAISDLQEWYRHIVLSNYNYQTDITNCIPNNDYNSRSPLYWNNTLITKRTSSIDLYAGINDGNSGSVPYTHSINFYNKILNAHNVIDDNLYISEKEIIQLSKQNKVHETYGKIQNRAIILRKKTSFVNITIFEGGHEILIPFAFDNLLQ
ncbi:alpha/beta hydrolase family protein [Maribacter sp. CXY002]|uniref:alpha/beta hydrolase family protein n=1 Tax=Maribacter luteocoastalis TaxID=3407671 RepID=UPI003B67B007